MIYDSNLLYTFDTLNLNAYNKANFKMEKIDKLDRQILNIISKNARIPFKDVAEECWCYLVQLFINGFNA